MDTKIWYNKNRLGHSPFFPAPSIDSFVCGDCCDFWGLHLFWFYDTAKMENRIIYDLEGGENAMRYIPELHIFVRHPEWWTRTPDRKFFIPTDKAPKEAVEAMEKFNERVRNNEVS